MMVISNGRVERRRHNYCITRSVRIKKKGRDLTCSDQNNRKIKEASPNCSDKGQINR